MSDIIYPSDINYVQPEVSFYGHGIRLKESGVTIGSSDARYVLTWESVGEPIRQRYFGTRSEALEVVGKLKFLLAAAEDLLSVGSA